MDISSRSLSEAEEFNSPKQLSYSRLGAEVEQEERQITKGRSQNKKLLELPQKNSIKSFQAVSEKEHEIISKDGPHIKINYSGSLNKLVELGTSNCQEESKQKPCSHSMMNRSGLDKLKQGLKAIIEKRQEDELGSSEKSFLASQIVAKIIIQNPCYSSEANQQNRRNQEISRAQSLTHRAASHFQKQSLVIRPINDSIEYQIDQEVELIQTSDRFTLPILPQVKEEGQQSNKINQQMAILSSLTTQSNKYNRTKEVDLKKSNENNQQIGNKVQKGEQNEILQKIKNLQSLVREMKDNREVVQRQDQNKKKQLNNKLEQEIAQIRIRLTKLQNQQKPSISHQKQSKQKEMRPHQIPKFKLNFLKEFLFDKIWENFYLFEKFTTKQKAILLSQILRSLNIIISFKIVQQGDQTVALCSNYKELAVIATHSEFYYGTYVFHHQKYIKNGYGLQFLPRTQVYVGNFHKNSKRGKGLLITVQKDIYQGGFCSDLKHGYGKNLLKNGDAYEGNYQQNKFQGKGLYIWKNGDFYQGQFVRGNMDGKGRWWSRNGDEYVGEYKNGLKQGYGVYTFASGKQFAGLFIRGKRVKDNNMHNIDKKILSRKKGSFRSFSFTKRIQIPNTSHYRKDRDKQLGCSAQKFRICFN